MTSISSGREGLSSLNTLRALCPLTTNLEGGGGMTNFFYKRPGSKYSRQENMQAVSQVLT